MSEREDGLSPRDIARMDKKRYAEPGRDLTATRPATALGAGAAGDVDNPVADEHTHGMSDRRFGSMGRGEPRPGKRDR